MSPRIRPVASSWFCLLLLAGSARAQENAQVIQPTYSGRGLEFGAEISLATSTPEAAIFYTLDGQEPVESVARPYSKPILVLLATRIKAVARKAGMQDSPVLTLDVQQVHDPIPAPIFTPLPSVFQDSLVLALSSPVPGAALFYTVDGRSPAAEPLLYTGPILIRQSTLVKAVAVKAAQRSDVSSGVFRRQGDPAPTRIASPGPPVRSERRLPVWTWERQGRRLDGRGPG